MRKQYRYYFLLIILLLTACYPIQQTVTNTRNYALIYNPGFTTLHPSFIVHNQKDSTSILYIKINLNELLFSQANEENVMSAKLKIHYKIANSYDNLQIVDSASTIVKIKKNQAAGNEMITYIKIKPVRLQQYLLEITSIDMIRNRFNKDFINVNKANDYNYQSFLAMSSEDFKPIFKNYFHQNQSLSIKYAGHSQKLTVKYFAKDFPLAAPPFSSVSINLNMQLPPDSLWEITDAEEFSFLQKYTGLYYIQPDTSKKEGLCLVNVNKNYPKIKTLQEMIMPLQYLTNSQEFKAILANPNKKIAVDDFWLNASGSTNQSKELIRIYYNRVMFANIYFTSYTQGWRTDRGMIYTIFGPPEIVYKTNLTERWTYSDSRNFKAITFEFVNRTPSFSPNDYYLKRSIAYKTVWYKAIESWRKGKVFSFAN